MPTDEKASGLRLKPRSPPTVIWPPGVVRGRLMISCGWFTSAAASDGARAAASGIKPTNKVFVFMRFSKVRPWFGPRVPRERGAKSRPHHGDGTVTFDSEPE